MCVLLVGFPSQSSAKQIMEAPSSMTRLRRGRPRVPALAKLPLDQPQKPWVHSEVLRSRRGLLRNPGGGPVDDPPDALDIELLADLRAPAAQRPEGVSRPDLDLAPQHDVARVDAPVDPERGDADRLVEEHRPLGDVHPSASARQGSENHDSHPPTTRCSRASTALISAIRASARNLAPQFTNERRW